MAVHPGYFFEALEPQVRKLVEAAVEDLEEVGPRAHRSFDSGNRASGNLSKRHNFCRSSFLS